MSELKLDRNIMYIMVIGFHHKRGCQLEFVHPTDSLIKHKPFESNLDSVDLYETPKKWKHLPSLALPDGSHNYEQDFIYFHLEDETLVEEKQIKNSSPNSTIFGVSCYRQINVSELLNKDSDVTRNTLQKSVCILTRLPIYSSLRLKLHSITTAYFEQKDFGKTQLLVNAFDSLTQSYGENNLINNHKLLNSTNLNDSLLDDKSKYYMGLSLADLVLRYQHKILMLFKLILLQKKCLFQLKPVSNLSNTIMALVSLIPEILSPNGLKNCSGYFDSIDLVNSELDRKSRKPSQNTENEVGCSQIDKLNLEKINKKMQKKKHKNSVSSSNKKSTIPASTSSPTIAISNNITNNTSDETIKSLSILNVLSTNTQKFFTFNTSSNTNSKQTTNNELDSDIYKLTHDEHSLEHKELKLDFKQNIYNSARSSSSSLNQEPEANENLVEEQIGDLIKSKVTNVFKLVDWSNNSSNRKSIKRSESVTTKITSNEQNEENQSEEVEAKHKQTEIQLSELLEFDFGMPLNLFNEFNILHPYLSLYYLEYFTMINKMSTKLYCTTALMMNMMKDNREEKANEPKQEDESSVTVPNQNTATSSYDPLKKKQEPKTLGYTIGATNILFKQRLYDDIDAFIDETELDLKNNEQLKKQLQLTTADLRFVDYIIKNVSSTKNLGENRNTAQLLSFKKTSSYNNFDKTNSSQDMMNDSGWEGSDDWIRLNFKWYLYSLMGSIVKEEISLKIKNELESILVSLNSDLNSSTSSSLASLENEVVDIDDYIEKVNNSDVTEFDRKKIQSSKKNKKNRKNSNSTSSSSTISSSQYFYIVQNSNSFQTYREDFNSNFINELKKTDCFQIWSESNREKIEKSMFKFDSELFNSSRPSSNSMSPANSIDSFSLTNRFQTLYTQLQEIEQIKLNHPFNGQISVNDIKLRFNFLFTTTESGKKINKVLSEGNKIVNNTGKAVGDALNHAKSTFSSFLSNWSSNSNSNSSSKNSNSKNFTKI